MVDYEALGTGHQDEVVLAEVTESPGTQRSGRDL
jgi:hypothetical protein